METNEAESEFTYELAEDVSDVQEGDLADGEANYIQVQTDEEGNLLQDEHGNLVPYVPMDEDGNAQDEGQEIQHQRVERIIDENGEVHHVIMQDSGEYGEDIQEPEEEENAETAAHEMDEEEQVMLMENEGEEGMLDGGEIVQDPSNQTQQMVYVVRAGSSAQSQVSPQKSKILWITKPNQTQQLSHVVTPQTIQSTQPRVIQLGGQTILLQSPSDGTVQAQQQPQKILIRPSQQVQQQHSTQQTSAKPQIFYVKHNTAADKPQTIGIIANQQPTQALKSPQKIAPRLVPVTSAMSPSFHPPSTQQQLITVQASNASALPQYVSVTKHNQRQVYAEDYTEIERPLLVSSKKPCNCTKSQCLKLYCDCFANGEFCQNCNCVQCYNNLNHEEERSLAVKLCIERNPNAFHPKIGKYKPGDKERRHTKGCNCKKSGCLKNYCECYEARILCSAVCRCVGCHNIEENMDAESLLTIKQDFKYPQPKSKFDETLKRLAGVGEPESTSVPSRLTQPQPELKISSELIDATCECLLSRAAETSDELAEKAILEEFGHCLAAIIGAANSRVSSEKVAKEV